MTATEVRSKSSHEQAIRARLRRESAFIEEERERCRLDEAEHEPDNVDAAALEVDREFCDRLSNELAERQTQIRRAEERLREGTYGICAFCQEPIPQWRLEVIPWAEFCLRCQELTESWPRRTVRRGVQ